MQYHTACALMQGTQQKSLFKETAGHHSELTLMVFHMNRLNEKKKYSLRL